MKFWFVNYRILEVQALERKGMVDDNADTEDNMVDETVNTVQSVDIEDRQFTTVGYDIHYLIEVLQERK